MLGFLLLLGSSAAYGFSNAYWKKAVEGYSFLQVIFTRGLITSSFFAFCLLIDLKFHLFEPWVGIIPSFTTQQFLLSMGLCFFSAFGLYFFVRSLRFGAVSLIVPISSINLFGMLTMVFVLGESWKINASVAFLLVCAGVYLLFLKELQFKRLDESVKSALGALLTSFFWGVSYTLFKIPVSWLGVLPFTLLLEGSVTVLIGLFLLFQKHAWQSIPIRPLFVLALSVIAGSILLHLAYSKASMTQIIFVGKSQLVLTLFFSRLLYREKISRVQWLGIVLLIFSIYIVT